MSKSKKTIGLCLVMFFSCVGSSFAGDTKVSGFLRAGGALNLGDDLYLERIDKNGNTGDTHFGVNIASDITDNMSVAGQLWASGAEGGAFEMVLDWAYASWNIGSGLNLNGGKIKYPNLLVSDTIDIGISYPWIRPPQELYTFDAEGGPNMSLESFVGGSAVYTGFAGDLEYSVNAYLGESYLEGGNGTLSKMMGAAFDLGTDAFKLKLGYNMHMPEGVAGDLGPSEINSNNVSTLSFGAKINMAGALIMSEYAASSAADVAESDIKALYATLGYSIGSMMPHFTYASRDAEESNTSMTFGLKYQINPGATLKFDFTQVSPVAEEGMEAEEAFSVISAAMDVVF
ncbi:MAG: hypothetical protein OEZ58_15855 [Gammaproteobacteria bacterium]|nr:hypothetical protein [Gammaproteobacteria bacterium]MDH5730467.1 hypothetical protein [Gammaproteobacteria bacterium]